jgi:hypothetical protein
MYPVIGTSRISGFRLISSISSRILCWYLKTAEMQCGPHSGVVRCESYCGCRCPRRWAFRSRSVYIRPVPLIEMESINIVTYVMNNNDLSSSKKLLRDNKTSDCVWSAPAGVANDVRIALLETESTSGVCIFISHFIHFDIEYGCHWVMSID